MTTSTLYSENRARLAERLKHGVAIFTAYDEMQRSNDMAFPFDQEATFRWMTGIVAARWKLIIEPHRSLLVAPHVDEVHALFDGSLSAEAAREISGVDEVITAEEYTALLPSLVAKYGYVYTLVPNAADERHEFTLNPALERLNGELRSTFTEVRDCRGDAKELRAIKQPAEIDALKEAIRLSAEGFSKTHSSLKNYTHEYEIEAYFNSLFRQFGHEGHAYSPIIAGGKNACTLHYNSNNDVLPKNGLVLLDIGAKYNGYAADITRTYAVGTPSERERAVHVAVEHAHQKIIELITPGLALRDYQTKSDEIMKDALQSLELLEDRSDNKTYRTYFPHAISHGLGLDVHESLGGFSEFKPGMVLTVEPGIYIPEEGIGVRIEDDILVTDSGRENLSAHLPTAL